jgi:hypothetical protein
MAATAQVAGGTLESVLPAAAGRAGFGGTLRSEFTKIRSVRSTYWTLAAMIVITIGISALLSWGPILRASRRTRPRASSRVRHSSACSG